MAYYIGSVGFREYYVYKSEANDELRCVCLLLLEDVFIEIDVLNDSVYRKVSQADVDKATKGKLPAGKEIDLDEEERRLTCFRCECTSEIGDDFEPENWRSLRVDQIHEDNLEGWDSDEVCEWIKNDFRGGLADLFYNEKNFCEQCVTELDKELDSLIGKELSAWVATQTI